MSRVDLDPTRRGTGIAPWALARELACFVVPALAMAGWIAWAYARDSWYIGTWDTEQILWQARNLVTVMRTGDALLRDSFLGVPTPYTYTPSLHGFSLPCLALAAVTGPCFANNFLALAVLVANFAAMYGVLRLVGLSRPGACTGAGIFLLGPATLLRSVMHIYLATSFFLPVLFYVFYLDVAGGFRVRHWLVAGLLVACMFGMHEYLGILGWTLCGIVLTCNLGRLGWRRTVLAGGAAAGVFLFLSLPVLWMQVAQARFDREHGIRFERVLAESVSYSSAPRDFVVPAEESRLGQWWAGSRGNTRSEGFNYLGLLNLGSVVVLAAWALARRDLWRDFVASSPMLALLWRELALACVGGLVASLGPRWKPDPRYALPVMILLDLHILPFSMMRAWGRFGFVSFFVLALVTAHLVDFVMRRGRHGWGMACLLLVVAFVDQVPMQRVPAFRVPVPAAIRDLAREPGRFMVLHLPLASTTGSLHSGVAQVMQCYHGKPIGNGYASFLNPLYSDLLARSPLRSLDHPTLRGSPPCQGEELARWLVERNVRYLVYEKRTQFEAPYFTPAEDRALRVATEGTLAGLAASGRVRVILDDDDYILYRVVTPY